MLRLRKEILLLHLLLFGIYAIVAFFFHRFYDSLFLLALVAVTQWVIIRNVRPIHAITRSIQGYKEEEFLRPIILEKQGEEFSDQLVYTLNSLSERLQQEVHQLTQQRKETEGILESLGEGVIAIHPNGTITFANRVACQMIGSSHEEMIGRKLKEISSRYPDLIIKAKDLVSQVVQTLESTVETWTTAGLYFDLISAPLAHQNGVILVIQDKTSDHKILEMGKDFIANASHELRTPLTVIRGFAEMLQEVPNLTPTQTSEITDKIIRTCGRINKLVKSLLTLSDLENFSKDLFQKTSLRELVENCSRNLLTIHPKAHLSISCEKDPQILAEPDLFEMAISNLLDNAVKYSQAPAEIEIRIKEDATLEIQDHGIGIPEADLPHIFDRFYTVDKARSRKSGGAGLGLSIVKAIIEKHDGLIIVSSKLGHGTLFRLLLPKVL